MVGALRFRRHRTVVNPAGLPPKSGRYSSRANRPGAPHTREVTDTVDGRAAFQILVLPYRQTAQGTEYALFRRADAAWGPDVLVIPEYAFGACAGDTEVTLSDEHTEYGWFTLHNAAKAVQWDSNRTAPRELDHRPHHGIGHGAA